MPEEQPDSPMVMPIAKTAQSMLLTALSITVVDDDTFKAASEFILIISENKKKVGAFFEKSITAAHAAHKAALAQKKSVEAPLLEAEKHLRDELSLYLNKKRVEAEEIADRLRRNAEDAQIKMAEDAEKEGLGEVAESLLETPISLPPIPVGPSVDGISSRKNTKIEVFDLKALVRAIADGKVPIQAVEANEHFIKQEAGKRGALFAFPGVRVYSDTGIVVGKRK